MNEVMRGAMDAPDGDAGEWAFEEEPMKPTWEQIVAMQKESAALRAQAAAVLPALPAAAAAAAAAATPRARRAPSRNEYPLFIPSSRDPSLLSGNHHHQQFLLENLQGQADDSFGGRLRHGSDSRSEIVPVADKPPPFVSRHTHSLSMGLGLISPEMSGITPKSALSGKSDGTNVPVTPASLSTSTFLQEERVRKQSLFINPGESSRGAAATRQVRDTARRGREISVDAGSPTDDTLWKGCSGSSSMVAPLAEGASATGSGLDVSPLVGRISEEEHQQQQSTEKPRSQQFGGLFGFLPWGKKASNAGHVASSSSMRRQSTWERDSSSKDVEKLIKGLQARVEQSEKQRVREVRELQSMLKDMHSKFEQLHSHCRNLERQMNKHAQQQNLPEYHVNEDDSSSLESGRPSWQRSVVPHPRLTPELFMSTFDTAVISLRRLSRAICLHIREMGESASQVITTVLENHSIAKGRLRKAQKVLYFESFLNQIMFENFENTSFEPSGGAPVLDPVALQQLSFQAFRDLESVTWTDIEQRLDEQGVIVNPNFHQFFVVRMEIVLHELGEVGGDSSTTPGSLISAFFDAVKAVWLLHHLAFSFRPAATILRVSQGVKFEADYMEQVQESDKESRAKSVFLMINPGFAVEDWVVKCRVYCSRN